MVKLTDDEKRTELIHKNLRDEVLMIENRMILDEKIEEEHYKYLFDEIDRLEQRIKELENKE